MEIGLQNTLQIIRFFSCHFLEIIKMQQIFGTVHGVIELKQISNGKWTRIRRQFLSVLHFLRMALERHSVFTVSKPMDFGAFAPPFLYQHVSVGDGPDKISIFMNRKSNNNATINNMNRNDMIGDFVEQIRKRFMIGLDVEFPVPSYIESITLSHVDKLDDVEQVCCDILWFEIYGKCCFGEGA